MPFAPTYFSIMGLSFYILFVLGLLVFFSGIQTGVWVPSFTLNGMILLLIVLLFAFTISLLFILRLLNKPFLSSPIFYLADIEFFRNKQQHLPSLLGLILSSVLVLGIVSTRDVLKQKLSIGKQTDAPNIFLVDIQKSQLPDIKDLIKSSPRYANFNESPLIRARLTHINDVPLTTLKENAKQKKEVRKLNFLNRTFNLTYKDQLNKSEKIIKGEFWQPGYEGPGISLESEFAKNMSVKLGDRLGFDLAGLSIEGQITSIRTINWGSLLPNFFVTFPVKKLEDAPQFIIGSAHIELSALSEFQNKLGQDFPNISVINLTDIFKKVQFLFEKVLKVLLVSTALCILSSLVIMASTLLSNLDDTTHRHHLLKSISMNQKQILFVDLLEKLFYFISLVFATLCLHIVLNYFISQWIKEEIPFDYTLFFYYSLVVCVLVYSPLILKLRKPS
jgi:putative ABC transport system permease protein